MRRLSPIFLIAVYILTNSCSKELPGEITVATHDPVEIIVVHATLKGEIVDAGGGVTAYGHCWARHSNPELKDFYSDLGKEDRAKEYLSEIDNLMPDTRYFYRAYAMRNNEIVYGEVYNFKTLDGKAVINTTGVYEITATSAKAGGIISSAGGSEIQARGICWNTVGNPTVDDYRIEEGAGKGEYFSLMTDLTYGVEYFVRAWAETQFNVTYGEEFVFTAGAVPPTVAFSSIISMGGTFATMKGEVVSSGMGYISANGMVWSTSENPTISDNMGITADGDQIGYFTTSITGLQPEETYFFRAYSTTIAGTGYSDQITITTVKDGEIYNGLTEKTWMDRNLGASRVAQSIFDTEAYGDLYQWGRGTDGHEKRTSGFTDVLSNSDNPGHGDCIQLASPPDDWRSPQNHSLWDGVDGINNPCPPGYRLPTFTEWDEERQSWSSSNAVGAFNSVLKLPAAGFRPNASGSNQIVTGRGLYWTSMPSGNSSYCFWFDNINASVGFSLRRFGFSVRCIKD